MNLWHKMTMLSQASSNSTSNTGTNVTTEQAPAKSKWEAIRDMKWPVVVLVALVGLFNSNLAKDLGDALNKPDIVAPDGSTKPAELTQEEISNLIVKTLETVLPKLLPKPDSKPPVTTVVNPVTPDAPKPSPVTPVTPDKADGSKTVVTDDGLLGILVTNEEGRIITASTVDAGQLFRVSAKNAKGKVAWQTSKHGDVRILASTDGSEYFGYLKDGQWVEFGLTDFGAQKQVSLRISCNQGPQPPPVDPVEPVVDNTKPVPSKGPVSLFVLYDKNLSAEAAAIMTATDVWNSFKTNGSEWRFVNKDDSTVLGMKVKNDNGNTEIPSLIVYEKASMRLLSAQPLPLTTEALVAVVKKYTGG